MTEPVAKPERVAVSAGRRGLARLSAVQALYQIELTSAEPKAVVTEFATHRLGQEIDGDRYADADRAFFGDLVGGASARRADVDSAVSAALPADWPLPRLEAVLRAILRAGAYELLARADVPGPVIINEYVEIARAFYDGKEPGMVNGVLDRVARTLRPEEGLARNPRDGDPQPR
jgi:N utilization substance protein B